MSISCPSMGHGWGTRGTLGARKDLRKPTTLSGYWALDRPTPGALPRRWERPPERHRPPRKHLLGTSLTPELGLVGEPRGRGQGDGFRAGCSLDVGGEPALPNGLYS